MVVLTADKGMVMVVRDREGYIDKAHLLLADTNMCRPILKDPTNKPKNKLAQTLRDIKNSGDSVTANTEKCTPAVHLHPNSMAYLNYIKLAPLKAHCLK